MSKEAALPSDGHDGHTIARNTVYNLLGRGLPLVATVAAMPFVVEDLGETRFGLFSIGIAVISSFFVFDLGLGRAVAKYAAAYRASDRESDVPTLLWSAVLLQTLLGIVGGLLLLALTPVLVDRALAIPEDLVQEAKMVFYLLSGTIVLALVEFSFAGALEAYQRFGLLNVVRAPVNILSLLFIIWVAQTGAPLTLFFEFFLATRVVLTGLLIAACARTIPGLFANAKPSLASLSPLIHFGKWVTVSNLVAPALLYADRFLLASIGSLGQVAYYTAPFQVAERLLIIPGTLTSTIFPAISALDSADSNVDIRRLSAQALHYLVCIMGLACVPLAAAAPWIVHLLFGEVYLEHSVSVFRILLLGLSINALAFVPYSVVQGCGRPDITAKFHLIEFPLHIVLLAIGYRIAGLPGVAVAWSLRVSLDCALLLAVCHWKNWVDAHELVAKGALRNTLVFVILGGALSLTAWDAPLATNALAIPGIIVLLLYTFLWAFSKDDRAEIWRFIRRRRDS